jgi:Zn-dependent protease with chaperone function
VFAWLGVGLWRNWRGLLAGLVSTWLAVPFAVFMAVVFAVVFGLVGFFGWLFGESGDPPAALTNLPVLGPALESFLPLSGSVVAGLVGVVVGLVVGFVAGILIPLRFLSGDDPVAGFGTLVGVVATGGFFGLAYTMYRVILEGWILRLSGARRLSRRERELILPIVHQCVARMGIGNYPPILIDDSLEPNATAYTRHIVVSRGLLERFDYDQEVVGGVLSHELVHWRNGDPISAAFLRGVAFPLYAVYASAGWVRRRADHPVVTLLEWLLLWPLLLTVKAFVMPMQAADARRAEFRADQGAVLAGYRDGLRRILTRMRRSFETGRNGWTEAVCDTHPPNELRLERLEDPSRHYPLPDPDQP